MTNYVGEEGENCVLKAAVSISNPYNLEIIDQGLRKSWMGWYVYTRILGSAMRHVISKNADVLAHSQRFDYETVMNTDHLFEFDREVQCPTWGYPTEGAYYRDASSTDALLAVRIPYFCVHAEDDPVRPKYLFCLNTICSDFIKDHPQRWYSIRRGGTKSLRCPLLYFRGWPSRMVRTGRWSVVHQTSTSHSLLVQLSITKPMC